MTHKELLLIGGHPELGGEIYEYLADLAKPEGKIGYIGFASTDENRARKKTKEVGDYFASKNIELVQIETKDDCYGLGVILIGGGNQNKLLEKLHQTEIDELLRPAWKYGDVVLAGSSAGAQVLFWEMLSDPGDDTFGRGSIELTAGMGPMSGGFVIPHFSEWTTADFNTRAQAAYADKLIIGVDENTALRWRTGVCDVLGQGSVTLMGRSGGVFKKGEEFELGSTQQ